MKKLMIFVILSVFGALAFAGCRHHSPEQRAEWITKRIASELNLDEAQKAKLSEVAKAILEQRKSHKAQMDATFVTVTDEILKPELDRKVVEQVFEDHHKTMKQDLDIVFVKVQEFHRSLKPEQKSKAVERLKELKEKFSNCHGD